jgi:hypothetical protein
MCRAKTPKVEKSAPPPMHIPEQSSPEVIDRRERERRRARSANGRQSTILAGAGAAPTSQAKTLLGS